MTELQLEVGRRLGREGGEGELNSATDQVLVVIDDDHDGDDDEIYDHHHHWCHNCVTAVSMQLKSAQAKVTF